MSKMETNTYRVEFKEIFEQASANPNPEGRATAVQHRIRKLYSNAIAALDLAACRAITEEWALQEIGLGQAISGPQSVVGTAREASIGAGRG